MNMGYLLRYSSAKSFAIKRKHCVVSPIFPQTATQTTYYLDCRMITITTIAGKTH